MDLRPKIVLQISRSDFVENNHEVIDINTHIQTLSQEGAVYLDDIAKGFNYLCQIDILNWNEIKDTIDADYVDDTFDVNNLEVSFDWDKYDIQWVD